MKPIQLPWLSLLLFIFGFCMATMGLTQIVMNATWRDIIANKGCAEYYLDDNHQRQWRWK